ncbi:MAG: DsrE family protein [Luminiphilus sp.]|nr:DsrE family protein [Luminiphilus sp.]
MDRINTWLFIVGNGPYTHGLASDPAIDATLAAGAFGQTASVLFVDDGRQYLDQGISPPAEHTDLRKLLKSLPLYDIDHIYVTSNSAAANIDFGDLPVIHLETTAVASLLNDSTHVVTFT